jgi:hypothetical protein
VIAWPTVVVVLGALTAAVVLVILGHATIGAAVAGVTALTAGVLPAAFGRRNDKE